MDSSNNHFRYGTHISWLASRFIFVNTGGGKRQHCWCRKFSSNKKEDRSRQTRQTIWRYPITWCDELWEEILPFEPCFKYYGVRVRVQFYVLMGSLGFNSALPIGGIFKNILWGSLPSWCGGGMDNWCYMEHNSLQYYFTALLRYISIFFNLKWQVYISKKRWANTHLFY